MNDDRRSDGADGQSTSTVCSEQLSSLPWAMKTTLSSNSE